MKNTVPASDSTLSIYIPSGRISRVSLPVVFLIGLPLMLVLGWLYAHALAGLHSVVLSIFVSAFLCTVIAIVVSYILTRTHSRSRRFNQISAAGLSFACLWAKWITTLLLYHMPQEATMFASSGPIGWIGVFHRYAELLSTMPGESASGFWLVAGWLLEAFLLIGMSISIGQGSASEPYSETAQAWAKKGFGGELFWDGGSSEDLLEGLKHSGPTLLLQFHRASALTMGSAIASTWWTTLIEGHWVETDSDARWLNVSLVIHQRTSDGKIKSESSRLLDAWHVSDADYAAIASHLIHQDSGQPVEDDSAVPGDDSTASRLTPIELAPAVTALEAENHAAAITLAGAHCQHPQEEVRADAHRLCALAHARLLHWDDAFQHYHALFEIEPTAFNAMQLASTSVVGGQLLRGNAWFEKAVEINQVSSEIQRPVMHTQFISALEQAGELVAARPHLDWLANAYRLARTTDGHLLWSYGLPFFGTFLEKSLPILKSYFNDDEIKSWYESMKADLDEDGGAMINQHLTILTAH